MAEEASLPGPNPTSEPLAATPGPPGADAPSVVSGGPLQYAKLPPAARIPSIIRVVGAVLLVLIITIAGQAVLGAVAAIILGLRGVADPVSGVMDLLGTPGGFISAALVAQLALVGVAWVAVRRWPGSWRDQLGLGRSRVPIWGQGAFVLGTFWAAIIGIGLSSLVGRFVPSDNLAECLWGQITWVSGVPYVLFVAIVPGIVEEAFFRGYVQRRLLQRWRPAGAIALSTALFSVMHLDPAWVAFVVPIGLWLGVLAWRTGSVRPGMLCHACLNGLWNVHFIIATKLDATDSTETMAAVGAGIAALVGFVAAVVLLKRLKPVSLLLPSDSPMPIPVVRAVPAAQVAAAAPLEPGRGDP